ncbi:hypothetical protein [Hymenobacter sp. BRD67]|uniref:hypothetical protein n=1 Tax=Hymenobacter sp. BRD67 TaxID=2675877 RepID=UPI0015667E0A|nr:hypothetical protein [Hymenobacter sp. BRD67]QKG51462.1 hypothetical protein GKZ67_01250 [Hymenobacter sp. BRD67]
MTIAARTIYFKNDVGCLWEEPLAYLRLEYCAGSREESQFRALLTHTRQALQRRGWSKLLIDQQQMSPFTSGEEAWMTTEWLPRAVLENGYRYGAVVVAHDVFARLAMTNVVMTSRRLGHIYRSFEHDAEAIAWLVSLV